MTEQGLIVADEVATALAAGRPVVALETTLVTHGLPQPHGLRVAHALEAFVRPEPRPPRSASSPGPSAWGFPPVNSPRSPPATPRR